MPRRLAGPVRHINPNSAEGRRAFENAKRPRRFGGTVKQALERRRPMAVGEREEYLTQKQRDVLRAQSNNLDQITDFKKWLTLFFVTKGHYKVTEKGIEEFGRYDRVKQHMEFAEVEHARNREERIERKYGQTKKQKKERAKELISKMLDEGQAEYLVDSEYIQAKPRWMDKEVRIQLIGKFVKGKEIKKIGVKDFRNNGLYSLISFYKSSPYHALVEAGYAYSEEDIIKQARTGRFGTDKIYPWEMEKAPQTIYNNKEMRVAAVKWLVWKLKKDAKDIRINEFDDNGLCGLRAHYNGSAYHALVEAGYAYSEEDIIKQARTGRFGTDKIYPWEMQIAPSLYHKKGIRVAAVKWLVWKLKKDVVRITSYDFYNNGFSGLFSHAKNSTYHALVEAGYAYSEDEIRKHAKTGRFGKKKVYPWEMDKTPSILDEKETRIAGIKWLVWKLKKDVKEMGRDDFSDNGLAGFLGHYKNSPYLAFVEAGYAYSEDEIRKHAKTGRFGKKKVYPWEIENAPSKIYNNKEMRVAAVKWLVWKLKKDANGIGQNDFRYNSLSGLIQRYNGSPYLACLEAGLVTKKEEALMRNKANLKYRKKKIR